MPKLTFALLLYLYAISSYIPLTGQPYVMDSSFHLGLTEVKNAYAFKTLTTGDSAEIPAQTLENLHQAKIYFDKLFNTKLDFAVLFVDHENWMQYAFFPPPGLPQAGRGNIILGLEKSVVAREVEKMLFQMPQHLTSSLKPVYGENFDLDLFYRESLSIHELAHLYHFAKANRAQRKWLQELFATLCMYAFFVEVAPEGYAQMNTYPDFVLQAGDERAVFKSLQDFDEKYVQKLSPPNYEWYQMKFYREARIIMDSQQTEILPKLLNFLIETDLSKMERLTDADLQAKLASEVDPAVAEIMINWEYPAKD